MNDLVTLSNAINNSFYSDIVPDPFIMPIVPDAIEKNFFQAGVGCGDDLHINDLISFSGYPLIHAGYFYLPISEYFLTGRKIKVKVQISGAFDSEFGMITWHKAPRPSPDLWPTISITDEFDYSGVVPDQDIDPYPTPGPQPSPYPEPFYNDTKFPQSSMSTTLYKKDQGGSIIPDDEIDPGPYPDPFNPYNTQPMEQDPWIKTYEPPINPYEEPITSGIFRKRTDLTGRRTYYMDNDDNLSEYEFELERMQYLLEIEYSGNYCDLTFIMHSGHIGDKVLIEYDADEYYTDHNHPLNPKYTPQYAGRFLTVKDEDSFPDQVTLTQVPATDPLPGKNIDMIASIYDQFGGPMPDQEVTFGIYTLPGVMQEYGGYIHLSGIYPIKEETTLIDGTAKATFNVTKEPPTPRGITLMCTAGGATGYTTIHPASFYRKKGQSYWFKCDISKFDCRAARSAIGQGFFSNYGKSYIAEDHPGSMNYEPSQWYYAIFPDDYDEYPDIFQEFGDDDQFPEESHSYIKRKQNTTTYVDGIYSLKRRFGSGKNAPKYTYYQAYHRPPIPYIDEKGKWKFPDLIDWYTRKPMPDENAGIWTIYDYVVAYRAAYPGSFVTVEDVMKESYVTHDGFWGQEIIRDITANKYNVYYQPVDQTADKINRGEVIALYDLTIQTIYKMLGDAALWDRRSRTRKNTYSEISHSETE